MTAEMKTSILDIRKRPLRRWHPHARRLIYLKRRGSNLRNGYTFRYLIVAPARRRALLEIYATGMLCPVHLGTSDSYQRRRMPSRPGDDLAIPRAWYLPSGGQWERPRGCHGGSQRWGGQERQDHAARDFRRRA